MQSFALMPACKQLGCMRTFANFTYLRIKLGTRVSLLLFLFNTDISIFESLTQL